MKKNSNQSWNTRALRVGGYSVAASAIVLIIAIVVNLLVGALPSTLTRFDMTKDQLFSVSEYTEHIVEQVEKEVTVYWIVRDGYQDTGIENLLSTYEGLNDKVNVKHIDPNIYPMFTKGYGKPDLSENSLIVECGEMVRLLDYYEIYVYDYTDYYFDGTYTVEFCGEGVLTAAIQYVVDGKAPKVYFLSGHGETGFSDTFVAAMEEANVQLEDLNLLSVGKIPEDADAVLVNDPKTDLSDDERNQLMLYLQTGGNMLMLTNLPEGGAMTNWAWVVSGYGVSMVEGIVVEGSMDSYAFGSPCYLLPELNKHEITNPLRLNAYYVMMPWAHGIKVEQPERDTVTSTQILTTSASAYTKVDGFALSTYDKEEGDIEGRTALGVAIEEEVGGDQTARIVWFSSSGLADDEVNARVSGVNLDLFVNSLNWVCHQSEDTITVRGKFLGSNYLTMTEQTSSLLSVAVIAIIPLAYLAVGAAVLYRRKRR